MSLRIVADLLTLASWLLSSEQAGAASPGGVIYMNMAVIIISVEAKAFNNNNCVMTQWSYLSSQ